MKKYILLAVLAAVVLAFGSCSSDTGKKNDVVNGGPEIGSPAMGGRCIEGLAQKGGCAVCAD